MDKKHLLRKLQSLRLKLHEIAEAQGSLTDPAVLAISEEADQLIVALQYIQRKELSSDSIPRDKEHDHE